MIVLKILLTLLAITVMSWILTELAWMEDSESEGTDKADKQYKVNFIVFFIFLSTITSLSYYYKEIY